MRERLVLQMLIVKEVSCVTVVRISAEYQTTPPSLAQVVTHLGHSGNFVQTGAVKKERGTVTVIMSAKETSYVLTRCAQIQWIQVITTLIAVVRGQPQIIFRQLI